MNSGRGESGRTGSTRVGEVGAGKKKRRAISYVILSTAGVNKKIKRKEKKAIK